MSSFKISGAHLLVAPALAILCCPVLAQPTVEEPVVERPITPRAVGDDSLVSRRAAEPWTAAPQPARNLEEAPAPSFHYPPGMQGLYDLLRADAAGPQRERRHIDRRLEPVDRRNRDPDPLDDRVLSAPYEPYTSPETPADPARFAIGQIVVKFVEGSAIRLRGTELAVVDEEDADEARARLARVGLESQAVAEELEKLNDKIRALRGAVARAATRVEESDLALLRRRAESRSGAEQPDPNLFFFVHLDDPLPEAAQGALAEIRTSRIVEAAYFQPIPFDAADIPPPTALDVFASQGYFRQSPQGIDVDFARRFAGGRGEDVRIADIEAGWHLLHEDFRAIDFGFGVNWVDSHGTAVLGQLAAEENRFGATGIVPNAVIGWSSVTDLNPLHFYFYSVAGALLTAGTVLRPGDIALIEQHFPNLLAGPCPNSCNCGQFGFVAVETFPYEHAAISLMSAVGVLVVEAAGNGQTMVVPAATRDSGAIVVGASNGALVPACFTNFGPRVNVHGWGGGIGTLGYGGPPGGAADPALRANGADPDQWYTRGFGGTSGASPIVVGAAALVQSTRTAAGLPKLTPMEMRSLLVSTGTAQGAGVNIGPLPDLRRAIPTYIPDKARFVRQSGAPGALSSGATLSVTVTFQNSGSGIWDGRHGMAVAPSSSGAVVWQAPQFPLGSAASPVMPGDEATRTFQITTPSQPGTYALSFVLSNNLGSGIAYSPPQWVTVAAPNTQFDNASVSIVSAPGSLRAGAQGVVLVNAQNTGSTSWTTGYSLFVGRSGRVALPSGVTVPVRTATAPNGAQGFSFVIQCTSPGSGGFSVQMSGPSGRFGSQAGMNVVCQP